MNTEHIEHWIPVTTSSGMFSSEYAILLKLANGEDVSFFIDKTQVKESAGRSLLRVV